MAGYLTRSGAELGEKLFEEVRLLLNDSDTIRSVSTVKLASTHGLSGIRSNAFFALVLAIAILSHQ